MIEGPTRVVIDMSGEAIAPVRALEYHREQPDIIYIREDGWSLGTPHAFDAVAHNMWVDKWVVRMSRDGVGNWWWRRFGGDEPLTEIKNG